MPKRKAEQYEPRYATTLPLDIWSLIIGSLSFIEIRKSCYRVCKKFKELSFQVVHKLSFRENATKKSWQQILSQFGNSITLLSINILSRSFSSTTSIKNPDSQFNCVYFRRSGYVTNKDAFRTYGTRYLKCFLPI